MPSYLTDAVQSARGKVAKGEPLGFDMEDVWQEDKEDKKDDEDNEDKKDK